MPTARPVGLTRRLRFDRHSPCSGVAVNHKGAGPPRGLRPSPYTPVTPGTCLHGDRLRRRKRWNPPDM